MRRWPLSHSKQSSVWSVDAPDVVIQRSWVPLPLWQSFGARLPYEKPPCLTHFSTLKMLA